jgi:anhydro-N-acetylmuramic acid kinase
MISEISGIGLMSGTSLDGLDIAFCTFIFEGGLIRFKIEHAETFSYPDEWKKKLSGASALSGYELTLLNHEFGKYSGERVNEFLMRNKLTAQFIASHGHTVFHQPSLSISTQIGSGAALTATTGITTVCDFRSLDVELGGQGAPLVPIGDELLFSEYEACLNLGGIANISFKKNNERIAFDVCVANMAINYFAQKLGLQMDMNGEIARHAHLNNVLLQIMNTNSFYAIEDKKSLGREWVEEHVLKKADASQIKIEDKIKTVTEHSAIQIAAVIKKNNIRKVLVTGGGAKNKFLIERITQLSGADIIIPDTGLIDFKEALIFALLGALRLQEKTNTLKSVTGAHTNSCGGAVYLGR